MCSGFSGKFRIFLLALGLGFLSLPALAQLPTATILGTVTDQQDAVVVGAKVTAKNSETGLSRTLTTGVDGSYRFNALPIGSYEIQIAASGFETETRSGLTLTIAQEAVVNVKMRVGATVQNVTVSAEAPLVDTTNATLGGVVSEQKIQQLPLNGRNYLDLMSFQPGVTQVTGVQGNIYGSGAEYVSNGATVRSNNVMLDGAILQNAIGVNSASVSGSSLGLDGIQEIKVITNMFTAEYGLTMGSQTVMASKSGTNQFHGDAFYEGRNSAFDARNFFDVGPKPEFQRDQFGGAFGGPIQKDKTFFWATFEGVRENLGQTDISNFDLPEAGCRGPAGAVIWNGQGTRPAGSLGPCAQLGPDPQGTGSSNSVTISKYIAQFFPMIPLPNFEVGQGIDPSTGQTNGDIFAFLHTQRTNENYGQMRVDHNFSSADSLFVRYTIDDTQQNQPSSSPGLGTEFSGRGQFLTLAENHIFSSAVINSLRLSYSRPTFEQFAIAESGPGSLNYTNASLQFPMVSSGQPYIGGVGANGWGVGVGGSPDRINNQNIYTVSDDVFWNKGKHAFKFGVLFNHYTQPMDFPLFKQGMFSSGSNADFLSGIINSFAITAPASDTTRDYLYSTYGFYAQDDFRVTRRLTVNLGLRYEFMGPLGEASGTSKTYEFRNFAVQNPQNTPPGGTTQGRVLQDNTLHNFGPRLGFAWDVFGDGKTSVRGGGGIFYDVANIGAALFEGLQSTPPLSYQNQQFGIANVPLGLPLDTTFPTALPGSAFPFAGANPAGLNYYDQQPTLYQWNLSVERQLPGGLGFTVSYVGSRGLHLWNIVEGNPAVPDQMLDAQNPLCGPAAAPFLASIGQTAPANCTPAGVAPPSNTPGGLTWNDAAALCTSIIAPPPPATINPTVPIISLGTFPGFGVSPTGNPNNCRVNPYYGDFALNTTTGQSWYEALEVEVQKRVSHGFQFQSSYTYSKLEDTSEGQYPGTTGTIQDAGTQDSTDPFNVMFDKGPSEYDATHQWTTNLIYYLPSIKAGSGFLAKLANGWWTSNIISVRSGFAFAPNSPGGQFTNSLNTYGGSDRDSFVTAANLAAVQTGGFSPFNPNAVIYNPKTVIVDTPNPNGIGIEWFNPNMFAPQTPGTLGDVPRGILRGPGYAGWDFALGKDTKLGFLGEAGVLRFRAEFFNVLNHPGFLLPNYGLTGFNPTQIQSGAGIITQTLNDNQREIQFTLRMEF